MVVLLINCALGGASTPSEVQGRNLRVDQDVVRMLQASTLDDYWAEFASPDGDTDDFSLDEIKESLVCYESSSDQKKNYTKNLSRHRNNIDRHFGDNDGSLEKDEFDAFLQNEFNVTASVSYDDAVYFMDHRYCFIRGETEEEP
jgi:hypothetical protein